jgi:Ulp1 family protease
MTERCMQMFFPIIFQDHWVLLCVSMFMKQIAFFDSLSASKESSCLKCAQNLVSGSVDSLLFILLLLK